jgi:hypothetical protein
VYTVVAKASYQTRGYLFALYTLCFRSLLSVVYMCMLDENVCIYRTKWRIFLKFEMLSTVDQCGSKYDIVGFSHSCFMYHALLINH